MASEYALQTEVQKLADRAADLKATSENEVSDLSFYVTELTYITHRAEELRVAADDADVALSKIA